METGPKIASVLLRKTFASFHTFFSFKMQMYFPTKYNTSGHNKELEASVLKYYKNHLQAQKSCFMLSFALWSFESTQLQKLHAV